jgi:MFS family permease
MTVVLIIVGGIANTRLLPRTGPRPLLATGMVLSAAAMVLLTQLGAHSSYATQVLSGLVLAAIGLGLVFAPATDLATRGVEAADAGVASALVNTMSQVGGSLGTALLNTLSASAVSSYLSGRQHTASVINHAAVHGYATAFWWAPGIFAAGALLTTVLLTRSTPHLESGEMLEPQPAAAI